MFLFIEIISQLSFFDFKHVKTFLLIKLVSTKAYQIVDQTARLGYVRDISLSEGLEELENCEVSVGHKFFSEWRHLYFL